METNRMQEYFEAIGKPGVLSDAKERSSFAVSAPTVASGKLPLPPELMTEVMNQAIVEYGHRPESEDERNELAEVIRTRIKRLIDAAGIDADVVIQVIEVAPGVLSVEMHGQRNL